MSDHLRVELPGAHVIFTTRSGGSIAVDADRRRLEQTLGVRLVYGRQVHGADVARAASAPADGARVAEADGQVTGVRGLAPTVLTADCLPIAIAGAPGVVAMVHAGWRGLAAGVISEGVRAVRELGATGPLAAVIGPGAGVCCYEVGEEVMAAFGDEFRRDGRLDLKAIARAQLEHEGVADVRDVGMCTICSAPGKFFSHRRDQGHTGRQAGVAWLN